MDASLKPVEMIEPGSGRRCTVQGKDEERFAKAGYRRADTQHVGAEPEPDETAAVADDGAPVTADEEPADLPADEAATDDEAAPPRRARKAK